MPLPWHVITQTAGVTRFHRVPHRYIFVGLILMLWHRETHINHKGAEQISWTKRGSNTSPSDRRNIASYQLASTFVSRHSKLCQKHSSVSLSVSIACMGSRWFWGASVQSELEIRSALRCVMRAHFCYKILHRIIWCNVGFVRWT